MCLLPRSNGKRNGKVIDDIENEKRSIPHNNHQGVYLLVQWEQKTQNLSRRAFGVSGGKSIVFINLGNKNGTMLAKVGG